MEEGKGMDGRRKRDEWKRKEMNGRRKRDG